MSKAVGNMCKNDFYIAIIILLVAFLSFLPQVLADKKDDQTIFVYSDTKVLESFSFKQINNSFTKTFASDKGYLELEFSKDKGVRVLRASCPDAICQHTGYINNQNQTIVCLPLKMYVQIKSLNKQGDVDATAY